MSTSNLTLAASQLGKRFKREWIFRNFTYQFKSGVYAVTGPNGSGKSTLLQTLWGQLLPSTGSVAYEINSKTVDIEEAYKHLAIATPYMDLIDEFTLEEQIKFHFTLKISRNKLSVDEIIGKMMLDNAREKFIGNFSSGMKQRVKLGLAFFTQAQAIFLDEPGTNLDHQAFDWYQQQLASLPNDCLVFIASNQPSEYPASAQIIDIMDFK